MKRPVTQWARVDIRSRHAVCAAALAFTVCVGPFLFAVCVQAAPPAAPPNAFKNLQTGHFMEIPFTQWRVSQDIYVINADGSNLTALTDTPENECYPTWSPDGSKIAFAKRKGGHFIISAMNADGSNVHNLFEPDLTRSTDNVDCTPAWSPDGAHIAFTSSRDGNLEVYVMNTDGSNPRNLTNHPAADGFPAWSPDGAAIAFTSDRDGSFAIYACNFDGSKVQRLTDDSKADYFAPAWSPDGKKILITAGNAGRNNHVELLDLSKPGGEKTPVGSGGAWFGAWAPDGRRIAMTLPEHGLPHVDLLDLETNVQVPLLPQKETAGLVRADNEPAVKKFSYFGGAQWSPDGAKLVFACKAWTEERPAWSVRWLYLGAHGEIIAPRPNAVDCGNEIWITASDDGFALVHRGPKWSGTYATVRSDGKIVIDPAMPKEVDLTSAAQIWPYRDETGRPIAPPPAVIVAAERAASPPGIVAPEGALGWLFLCADGGFLVPERGTPIYANTLWVIRKGEGLEFIHTGPEMKGQTYATVAPNEDMTFVPNAYRDSRLCWKWGLVDEKGRPTFPTPGRVGPAPCEKYYSHAVLFPNGSIMITPPPIP